MSSPSNSSFALINIGGGEIILILVVLFILALVVLGFLGLIYLIVRAATNRPQPAPSTLSSEVAAEYQQRRDCEQIKLLAIFHFVFGGLALMGIAFLFLHYFLMHMMFSSPEMWKAQPQAMPPKAFLDVFIWLYFIMGFFLLTGLTLNVLSALFLLQKRNRFFSLIVGGLNCLQIPFGTALGVFTIVVLSRDSVCQLYGDGRQPER
jgi:hypothetical protein